MRDMIVNNAFTIIKIVVQDILNERPQSWVTASGILGSMGGDVAITDQTIGEILCSLKASGDVEQNPNKGNLWRPINTLEFLDTIDLPTWALSYIHYGDDSSIEQSHAAQVDEWLTSFADHHKLVFKTLDMDSGFTQSPAFGLACDCEKTEVWGHRKGYHAN